jgi:hypothetical protein
MTSPGHGGGKIVTMNLRTTSIAHARSHRSGFARVANPTATEVMIGSLAIGMGQLAGTSPIVRAVSRGALRVIAYRRLERRYAQRLANERRRRRRSILARIAVGVIAAEAGRAVLGARR